MFKMDFGAYRPGQLGAHMTIASKALSKITSIVLPTRYGKSDLIRCSYLDMHYQGIVSCAVVLSPADHLRKQMVKKSSIDDMMTRYKISIPSALHTHVPLSSGHHAYKEWGNYVKSHIDRGPALMSTTVQFAMHHWLSATSWLGDWIDHVKYTTGKPPIFYIDECHIGSDGNQIGRLIKLLKSCGGLVVVLTATPHRLDGEQIPGFEYELITSDVVVKYISSKYSDDKVLIKVMEQVVGTYKMKADYEYTFAEAWAEVPSPLAGLDIITIDFDCIRFVDGREIGNVPQKISALSPSLAKKVLSESIRDADVIALGASTLIETMRRLRQHPGCEDAASIIFVGNDTDDEDNKEAKRVQDAIKRIDPTKKVVIATSSTGDDAGEIIKRFVGDKNTPGDGDILVVKMMASLGLDCKRLKVGLDLSPIRSVASYTQRLMRVATDHPIMKRAYWISPADPTGVSLFQWVTTSQDGEIKAPIDVSMIDEYLKTKEEHKEESAAFINAQKGDVINHESVIGRREYHSHFDKFVSKVPQVMAVASQASIMAAFSDAFSGEIISTSIFDPDDNDGLHVDSSEEIKMKKATLVDYHRKLAGIYQGMSNMDFGDACKYAWKEMRIAVGLPNTWDSKAETSIPVLENCILWLKKKTASLRSAA